MPVDYIQIGGQIQQFTHDHMLWSSQLQSNRVFAMDILQRYSSRQSELEELVEKARKNPAFRCAVPTEEPLVQAFPLPQIDQRGTIIAVDGSQVIPSRHKRVIFGAINIGVIQMTPGSGEAPVIHLFSHLLSRDELYPQGILISQGKLNLDRDIEEREKIVQVAQGAADRPLVTLTDGPLELFRDPEVAEFFTDALGNYLDILTDLQKTGAATAGYVDKPRSDLVIRLLELAAAKETESSPEHPFSGLTDAGLYRDILKNPGDRSPLFSICSPTTRAFTGDLQLYFFYINVGAANHPTIARVEIPHWVVRDSTLLNRVHVSLFEQSQILNSRPFPYLLHRAHEIAVISFEDTDRLEEMILAEMLNQGAQFDDISNKQAWKDGQGRTRYGK